MAYIGETDIVDCSKGGIIGAKSIDALPSYAMVSPTRNISLEQLGRRKRGGTSLFYPSAFSGSPVIKGLFGCTFNDGTQYLLAATDDGEIYKDDTNTIATGLSIANFFSFAIGENKVFIADGVSTGKIWTGSGSVRDILHPATDFTSTPPIQFMKHGREASQRMCALNRNAIYLSKSYSADGDMEDFETGSVAIYIDTGDGYGLVGMAEFGEEIIAFGRNKAYRIIDTGVDTSEWGYKPAQWTGGAYNFRLLVNTPNDLFCMTEDGEIYSIVSVNSYGDYKLASLTRDSWMGDWIKENVSLAYINLFHAIYNPYNRTVHFFIVKNGFSACNMSLIYFIDRQPSDAWMIHDNSSYPSGFDASAAGVLKTSSLKNKVITGDYSGGIWELDKEQRSDNNNPYYGGFKTTINSLGNPRVSKHINKASVTLLPKGDFTLNIKTWIDGEYIGMKMANMLGEGTILGTFILGTDYLGGDTFIDSSFSIGAVGKRIQYEFFNSNNSEDFFISGFMTDFKNIGLSNKEG